MEGFRALFGMLVTCMASQRCSYGTLLPVTDLHQKPGKLELHVLLLWKEQAHVVDRDSGQLLAYGLLGGLGVTCSDKRACLGKLLFHVPVPCLGYTSC